MYLAIHSTAAQNWTGKAKLKNIDTYKREDMNEIGCKTLVPQTEDPGTTSKTYQRTKVSYSMRGQIRVKIVYILLPTNAT